MAFENTESHAIKAESAYAVARQYHVQGKYEQAEKFYKARPAPFSRPGLCGARS